MPNKISNWSITNVEKICRKYIKVGFQQHARFKKEKTSSQIFLAHGALPAFCCRMKIS